MNKIIIDGKNATMGRLASYVAKQAMLGKKVTIINSNDVLISGNKEDNLAKWKKRFDMGGSSLKGPRIIRSPERILKRVIRGMLSHKQERGKEALKRIICYNKMPEKYSEEKKIIAGKPKKGKYVSLKEIAGGLK